MTCRRPPLQLLLLLLLCLAVGCRGSTQQPPPLQSAGSSSAATAAAGVTPSGGGGGGDDGGGGGPGEFVFVIVFFCVGLVGFIVLVAYCTRYASSKSDRRAERYLFEVQERRRISQENAYKLNAALMQQSVPQITVEQCSSSP